MTQSEINKLHKSIAVDFKIVVRKTELWELSYCYQILHDIKMFMLFNYLETVSIIIHSNNNAPLKAKKYLIDYTSRIQDDRPGNIDWEDGEGQSLSVVLTHTAEYNRLSMDKKNAFQIDHLKIAWSPTNIDTNFSHLSGALSKIYTATSAGINRVDFN